MSINCSKSSDDTSGVGCDPEREDRRLLDSLVELWRSERIRGLEVRHKTGALLNERLGPPTGRQAHGRQVLKRVGEELRISVSDLSRMRWLAHRFPDAADIQRGDPKIESWTHFKEVLPTLKRSQGKRASRPPRALSPSVQRLARSLQAFTSKVPQLAERPGDAERALICECMQELAETFSSHLWIHFRFIVAHEVPTPDPSNGHPEARPSASDDGIDVVAVTTE